MVIGTAVFNPFCQGSDTSSNKSFDFNRNPLTGNSSSKKAIHLTYFCLCPIFPWRLCSQILWHASSKAATLTTDCAHSCVSASFVPSALLSVTSSLHRDYRLHLRIWLIPRSLSWRVSPTNFTFSVSTQTNCKETCQIRERQCTSYSFLFP